MHNISTCHFKSIKRTICIMWSYGFLGRYTTSLEKSDDDVPQRQSAEEQPAVDTPNINAQQDLTGNPVVIDLTNNDSIQGQILPSVPAAGSVATNVQPDDTQSDVAPKDVEQAVASASPLVSRPTPEAAAASTNYQLVSSPPAGQQGASTSYHSVLRPTSGQPVASVRLALLQSEKASSFYTNALIQSKMASSFYTNTLHVDFESVLAMDDPVLMTRNVIETIHDRRLTLTRLPTHLESLGGGLVTLAMSLFDLQDVCIAIGSLATLDLPMVVDLIGIYGLKGPYCTLTTTNWFLQALSVIPRGSWGDVSRRSYHDPMGKSGIVIPEPQWLWAHG
ncbi:putative protein phosphatase 2C 60 [Dorcoceras hygrometricum]|uniref:Uncharacterized protein n=1 Tax=Dorcoceras hygrometricum TaxID=472368 RepID=A0A2Z7BUP9_9LAMI|nr:putative protein phosphatase 2C 60 [Dorcoceras hygrometricum]